ncbi:hypothetical protein QMC_1693 [Clostridioides difficile DA00245]|nr:hypothetical protein QMC_1693 [Clostridioides difficile DA00245]
MNIGYSLCFILTMWYVNYSLPYVPGSYDWGFILTMWYVNKFNITGKGEMDIGFILTMWYVNFVIRISPPSFSGVLY